ncbi:MAG: hypothetical protein KU37_04555 [Sulfuricurvum sp. PC08-66]|nr:MAG: hypothetical protein KU37_04555 [Sulfuricurvum sp. PC08-66]
MKKILLLLLTITSMWACMSCSYGDAKVTTSLNLFIDDQNLSQMRVTWELDPTYSQLVQGDFDINRNQRFDANEKRAIDATMQRMSEIGFYIRPVLNDRAITLKKLENFEVTLENGIVRYAYTIPLQVPLAPQATLFIAYDEDAAFNNGMVFHLDPALVTLDPPQSATLSTQLETTATPFGEAKKLTLVLSPLTASTPSTSMPAPSIPDTDVPLLTSLMESLQSALSDAKTSPSFYTVGLLLLFSLLYGIVHAAGPGHGKTLVASYFAANDRSYLRALGVALSIATVHVASAFITTLTLYVLVHSLFAQTIEDTARFMSYGSGLIVLGIALYLARQKWRYYRPQKAPTPPKKSAMSFSATPIHPTSCGCHSCKTTQNSTDFMLILGASIVPCPGTIVLFLFALSMGIGWLGAVGGMVMSLGMGITIAVTAMASTLLRRKSSQRGVKLLKIIDIGSVGVMMVAGIALFLI